MTSRSGRHVIKHRMESMGYAESSYDLDHLYAKFLTLADKKGQVFDYDLEALAFFSQIHEEPEHFKLEYLGVQSGSSVLATASVKLKVGGEVVSEAATGNGPVDAVYQCINRITGYEIRIDKYALKSKGEGEDALGQVDIVAEYKGRKFHGMGLATDIIESSAHALLHVINSIWRADQVAEQMERNNSIKSETV